MKIKKHIKIIYIFLFIIVFSFISCKKESRRNLILKQKIKEAEKRLKFLNTTIEELKRELQIIWQRSLKYRFPEIKLILPGKISLDLKNLPYIKSIQFKFISNSKIHLIFNFETNKKKVCPNFDIYFFDIRGINIHREHIVYKRLFFFKKYLPVNKKVKFIKKVKLLSQYIPYYFLIKERGHKNE